MLPFYLFISCLSWPCIGKNFASGIYNPHYLLYSLYCRRLISLLIRSSQKIFLQFMAFGKFSCNSRFTESRNTSKSLYYIWQRSSPWLNEKIAKVWKQFSSHDGFLRITQDSKKMLPNCLDCLCTFLQFTHQVEMKNIDKYWRETFCGISPLYKHNVMFVATLFGLLDPLLNLSCLKQFTDKINRLVLVFKVFW